MWQVSGRFGEHFRGLGVTWLVRESTEEWSTSVITQPMVFVTGEWRGIWRLFLVFRDRLLSARLSGKRRRAIVSFYDL